jgi:hypothetical protein
VFTRRVRRSLVAVLWAILFTYVIVAYALRGQVSWWSPLVVFAALYLADVLSGVAHFVVDYTPNVTGVGLKELYHYQGSRASEDYLRRRKEALRQINGFQEIVFDFKVHHRTPAALGRRSFLVMTVPVIVYGALPITVGLVALGELGWMPPDLSLFVVIMVACGTMSQYVHACTHKKPIPWLARVLQRVGLLISPKAHDVHHRHPDRQFCLLNGWANPLVDRLFRFALRRGYFQPDGLKVI